MHAWIGESAASPERTALNQSAHVTQECATVSAAASFRVTQERTQRKPFGQIMPEQPHEPSRNAGVTFQWRSIWNANELVNGARKRRAQHNGRKRFTQSTEVVFCDELRERQSDCVESCRRGCLLYDGAQRTIVGRLMRIARNEGKRFALSKRHAHDVADLQRLLRASVGQRQIELRRPKNWERLYGALDCLRFGAQVFTTSRTCCVVCASVCASCPRSA